MRLLLLKQDEISMLEESLDKIDVGEDRELFLGCSRRDGNAARQQTFQELKKSLAEYGTSDGSWILRTRMANPASDGMLEQNHRALSLPESNERDIQSLRSWVQGTSSLARQETSYLERYDDLVNLTGSADNAVTRVGSIVEDCAFWLDTRLRRVRANRPSSSDRYPLTIITVFPQSVRKTPPQNHRRRTHLPPRSTPMQIQPCPNDMARNIDSAGTGRCIVQYIEFCRPSGDDCSVRWLLPHGRFAVHECEDCGAFCGGGEVRN